MYPEKKEPSLGGKNGSGNSFFISTLIKSDFVLSAISEGASEEKFLEIHFFKGFFKNTTVNTRFKPKVNCFM